MHKETVHSTAEVRYQTRILNPDGSIAAELPWKKNLILDQGLNNVSAYSWSRLFSNCAIGTSADPVKRDSGLTTFTRAGNVVTASANFFEAADVGRLIKFDSGEEMHVTFFTDAQNVTVNIAGALAASQGTVWYVNLTGHTAEAKRTNTTIGGAAENKTTFSVDTITHQRQFIFPAEVGPVTYREIGWSHSGEAGANLFGRDVIPGAGDSLVAGQQYQVIVTLIVKIKPAAITASPNVGTGGLNSAGNINHQFIGLFGAYQCFSRVGQDALFPLEPASDGYGTRIAAISNAYVLNPGVSTEADSGSWGALGYKNVVRSAYAAGSFTVDLSATFGVAEAVGNIMGFGWGPPNGGSMGTLGLALMLTTPQAKDSLHTLTVVLRLTWGRTLVN
jgi:hypothetical protein